MVVRRFGLDRRSRGRPADTHPAPTSPILALSGVPNPIRSQGVIQFWLARDETATLDVLDVGGRLIARLVDHQPRTAGRQEVTYDPGTLGNGIYFIRLTTRSRREFGRLAVVR